MPTKSRLIAELDSLIAEGEALLATQFTNHGGPHLQIMNPTTYVDLQRHSRWLACSRNLLRMLGKKGQIWAGNFDSNENSLVEAQCRLGTLEGIRAAVEKDLLVDVENLIIADAFADLLAQSNYLLENNYFVAAGVLGRAVLEEHLRKWCERSGCAQPVQVVVVLR